MELNRKIRDEFRAAGQTKTARLVVAINLKNNHRGEDLRDFITFTIQYVMDTFKIGSNLLLLGSEKQNSKKYAVKTTSGLTALMNDTMYLSLAKETAELGFSIIDAAPFGEKIKTEGRPKELREIVIGEDIMETIMNLRCWIQLYHEEHNFNRAMLPDELSHLGIILIKLGKITKIKLQETMDYMA